jgi:CBS domain-containing protein
VLIEHILHNKGSHVATTTADAPLTEVLAILAEHNVGALVVLSGDDDQDKQVAGIISERDIVRAVAEDGASVLGRLTRDIMSTSVTTCDLRATVDELMRLMTERRVRHIPVVEERQLVGIVSIGDVVKTRIDELETETETLHGYLTTGRG